MACPIHGVVHRGRHWFLPRRFTRLTVVIARVPAAFVYGGGPTRWQTAGTAGTALRSHLYVLLRGCLLCCLFVSLLFLPLAAAAAAAALFANKQHCQHAKTTTHGKEPKRATNNHECAVAVGIVNGFSIHVGGIAGGQRGLFPSTGTNRIAVSCSTGAPSTTGTSR